MLRVIRALNLKFLLPIFINVINNIKYGIASSSEVQTVYSAKNGQCSVGAPYDSQWTKTAAIRIFCQQNIAVPLERVETTSPSMGFWRALFNRTTPAITQLLNTLERRSYGDSFTFDVVTKSSFQLDEKIPPIAPPEVAVYGNWVFFVRSWVVLDLLVDVVSYKSAKVHLASN